MRGTEALAGVAVEALVEQHVALPGDAVAQRWTASPSTERGPSAPGSRTDVTRRVSSAAASDSVMVRPEPVGSSSPRTHLTFADSRCLVVR